ncbi:MAG: bacteriocin transport accessory protein, partial [Peptococcaceae bacterium]|nr:bacteriocin transport accessory protein [Peptococcaceae bacterium]
NNDAAKDGKQAESALDVLQSTWETYEDENKFAAGGGDSQNMVMDEPGKFDVANTEELNGTLGFPADSAGKIDDAASLMHMMNANTFTAGAYHVTNADDVQGVADALKESIMNRQWMCGFPETLIIVKVNDNYLVSAFGNGEIIETFKTKLTGVYADATVVYEESL